MSFPFLGGAADLAEGANGPPERGDRWTMWIGGVVIPSLVAAYGLMRLVTQISVASTIVLVSVALLLHFHFFWGLHPKLRGLSEFAKNCAAAGALLGIRTAIVMPEDAPRSKLENTKELGGEVLTYDRYTGDREAIARDIAAQRGAIVVPSYDHDFIIAGQGTVGLEICEQLDAFDALIVPIGGGGLMAGIANAVKQLRPDVEIIGVEPHGANTMHLSFDAGEPQAIDRVRSIADSLGAPYAMPYSFELCRVNVDRLVEVDDLELRRSMGFLFRQMKIAVEPACAASTATLMGPLREALAGKRVVLVFCGSNIDWATFSEQVIVEA